MVGGTTEIIASSETSPWNTDTPTASRFAMNRPGANNRWGRQILATPNRRDRYSGVQP